MRTEGISAEDLSGFNKEKIVEGFENFLEKENKHLASGKVYEVIFGTWQASEQVCRKGGPISCSGELNSRKWMKILITTALTVFSKEDSKGR